MESIKCHYCQDTIYHPIRGYNYKVDGRFNACSPICLNEVYTSLAKIDVECQKWDNAYTKALEKGSKIDGIAINKASEGIHMRWFDKYGDEFL